MKTGNKILILTTVHVFNDVRIFHKELMSISRRYSSVNYMAQIEKNRNIDLENVNIIKLPIVKNRFIRMTVLQFIVLHKILSGHYDVIHIHDPELIILAYLLKKILKKKIIFDIHENIGMSILKKNWLTPHLRPLLSNIYIKFEKYFISSFDKLIIAEKSYNEIYGENAVTILNYPTIEDQETSMIKRDYNQSINFVYSGGISEDRCIMEFLEIYNILNEKRYNVFFHLIGPVVNSKTERRIQDFIRSKSIENKIAIYGRLDIKDVYKIIKKSHVGIALLKPTGNYKSSLPTKMFEYMREGIPVVVSNFEIYNEYIVQSNTGIAVDINDLYSSAEQIENLITSSELMEKMGINGLKKVHECWNWTMEETKLFSVYDPLIKI